MKLVFVNILMAVPISVKRNIAQSPGEKGGRETDIVYRKAPWRMGSARGIKGEVA